jgi:hypothetical protein
MLAERVFSPTDMEQMMRDQDIPYSLETKHAFQILTCWVSVYRRAAIPMS